MSAPSRTAFLAGVAALRGAVTEPAVLAADEVGKFLRRGATVASYNLLETFVLDRIDELAQRINSGQTQFLDLPDRLQRRAISHAIEVASRRLRRGEKPDLVTLRDYSSRLGASLSAVGTSLELSPLMWAWPGSNMAAQDLHSALRFFHVSSPFNSIRSVAGRLSFNVTDSSGQPLDFRDHLDALAKERHKCAHESTYGVTSVWIRTLPDWVLKFAVGFDCLASMGALAFRSGNAKALNDEDWIKPTSLKFRFVRARAGDFREIAEGKKKATATGADVEALYRGAHARCSMDEVLVEQTVALELVRWSIPSVD